MAFGQSSNLYHVGGVNALNRIEDSVTQNNFDDNWRYVERAKIAKIYFSDEGIHPDNFIKVVVEHLSGEEETFMAENINDINMVTERSRNQFREYRPTGRKIMQIDNRIFGFWASNGESPAMNQIAANWNNPIKEWNHDYGLR